VFGQYRTPNINWRDADHQSFADGTGRIIASRSSVLMRIVLPQR